MSLQRIPPHNADAEQSVLASMLYDKESVTTVADILTAEDFYRPDHAEIYRAMIELNGSGMPVDTIMLKDQLIKRQSFDKVGGIEYLGLLLSRFSTSVNTRYHALEIKRHSETRGILKSLTDLLQKHDAITIDDLKNTVNDAENRQYIKSYIDKSAQSVDEFKQNFRVKKQRILTGFTCLDKLTGGFRLPSVAMIGAYPSVGKTAFALNIARNQTGSVLFFSLEMSCEMIYERMSSAKLKIDYNLFSAQELSEKQYNAVEQYADELKQKQFHVFDDAFFIEQQSTIISNIKPCLVVVDYIQKVRLHKRIENRRLEIDYISGMYKRIAKANNCVILALSQLSRGLNQSKSKPTMANLKESGALEADGDYIGILHRPYVIQKDNPGEVRPEDGYILIDKNKFGNTGQIDLIFKGEYQQFYETYKHATIPSTRKKEIKPQEKAIIEDVDDNTKLPFL